MKRIIVDDVQQDREMPKISVILSFYNEEKVIPELLTRLRAVFHPLVASNEIGGYELVFINDNSTDGSENLLIREMEAVKDIVLVNMSRNFGVSECVLAGMKYASGDAIVYMDADLQDPPEVIPAMIDAWKTDAEAEVVFTTRRRRDGEHPLKMLLTKVGYRFINSISDIELPVDSGDFKLLSRRAVNHLLRFRESKPYMRGLVSWIGFKQVQVLYDREPRYDGRTNTKFPVLSKRVIYGYLDRALISFSDAPLKMALFLGFMVSILAALYLVVVIFQKIMGWYVPGWPALMAAILFLGGVQITIMGIVGLYISSIFSESKQRPIYIVKEVIKPD